MDITRWSYDPRKHYADVRALQGRPVTDDDLNLRGVLTEEEVRITRLHVIGAEGSPDLGFSIGPPTVSATGQMDFDISQGTLYVGGLRLVMDKAETLGAQLDWLQQTDGDRAAAPTTNRVDLAFIEAWQQPVSSVEDGEQFEQALGGVDTSACIRTMRRVRVLTDVGAEDCAKAWEKFATTIGAVDSNNELTTESRLKVTFAPTGAGDDLCSPRIAGGYLGAENQAVRVELVDDSTLVWGFDNGAPLYRVSVASTGTGAKVTMITPPRDQEHWPLVGQVIEFLSWSAWLPNGEKVAEMRGTLPHASGAPPRSYFAKVTRSFDPDAGDFEVDTASPANFNDGWKTRYSPPLDIDHGGADTYYFMRVWNRGADTTPLPTSYTLGAPLDLGNTGLQVTVSVTIPTASPRAGDYWVIAARPHTPNDVVPWQLTEGGPPEGRPPEGPHRYYAPLGLIQWTAGSGIVIDDCRHKFPSLTSLSGCCTYRVGDGKESNGDFLRIQAAVDALPLAGGEICVLPGVYNENVEIFERRNVRLHGCGSRSRIVAPPAIRGDPRPAIHVRNSRGIRVDSLAAEAQPQGIGIFLENTGQETLPGLPNDPIPKLHDISLLNLRVTGEGRSAIEARDGRFIQIRACDIRMKDVLSAWPGIFFLSDDGIIEGNTVCVRSQRQLDDITIPASASVGLGGIQIGGTSDRVRIIDNLIQGGIGNGITLGSVVVLGQDGRDTGKRLGWVINILDPCNPCKPGSVYFPPPDPSDGDPTRTISAGELSEIRIERNRIYDMGLNGVGVVAYFDLETTKEVITVRGLSMLGNHVRGCLLRQIDSIQPTMFDRIGYGGIALAQVEDLVIWDNIIENNGPSRAEPVCGIFVLHGEGVDISRNHVVNNGAFTPEPITKNGARGGIVIRHVESLPGQPPRSVGIRPLPGVQSDAPSLRVHDNIVVAPIGRALSVIGTGSMSVADNQFVSQAVTPLQTGSIESFAFATVYINNLGRSSETADWKAGYQTIAAGHSPPSNAKYTYMFSGGAFRTNAAVPVRILPEGRVLFATNQVMLDLVEPGATRGLFSIGIVSLDDIGFVGNQCAAQLADDVLLANTYMFGNSVRATDNRWQENVSNAFYSALTLGLMNVTANNIATHCIIALAPPNVLVNQPNVILLNLFGKDPCGASMRMLSNFGAIGGNFV